MLAASTSSHQLPQVPLLPQVASAAATSALARPISALSAAAPGLGAGLLDTQSHLESRKVSLPTESDYRRRLTAFIAMCVERRWDWLTDEDLDAVLVAVLDELFFKGKPSCDGEKLIAAVKHFMPRFRRLGAGALPRAASASQAFGKLRPGQQRLPMPWVILMALCGVFLWRGQLGICLEMILSFKAYLRPGEADRLLVKCLVRPMPDAGPQYKDWGLWLHPHENLRPGKTGVFDESLILMKHLLCWDWDDIVYIKFKMRTEEAKAEMNPDLAKKILDWNQADHQLYDYFNTTFWRRVGTG